MKMKEFKIDGCISVSKDLSEEEFWNQFIDLIESKQWLFGGGINAYNDETMRVEIEVKDTSLNDVIIQCFQNRNIKHDKNLIFVSSGHKDDFSNMFLAMFEIIKDDDVYPMLQKVIFIDQDGDQEDVLSQAYKIRENKDR